MSRGIAVGTAVPAECRAADERRPTVGDLVVIDASPSMRVDLTGQRGRIAAVYDDGDIAVTSAGLSYALFFSEGDRWHLPTEQPVDWLYGSEPFTEEPWLDRPVATTPLAEVAKRHDSRHGDILFEIKGEAAKTVYALLWASERAIDPERPDMDYYYRESRASRLADDQQALAVRLAALCRCLQVKGVGQFYNIASDGIGLTIWQANDETSGKALEMIVEGFEVLGCQIEVLA